DALPRRVFDPVLVVVPDLLPADAPEVADGPEAREAATSDEHHDLAVGDRALDAEPESDLRDVASGRGLEKERLRVGADDDGVARRRDARDAGEEGLLLPEELARRGVERLDDVRRDDDERTAGRRIAVAHDAAS